MPFYVYAWIGAVVSGLFVITSKLTSKHAIANPWLLNFLLTSATLLFTVPVAIYYHAVLPNGWGPIILAAIFSTLFNIFYIFSTYNFDVSTLIPLFNFRSVFAMLIGISFFGEKLTLSQMMFIAVILMASMFSTMDEKFKLKSFFKRSVAIVLLASLFLAINNAFIKSAQINNTLWTTNLWIALLNFFMLIPTIPLFKKELKKLDIAHILPVGAMGIFGTITGFAANMAYKTNLSVSSLIMNIPFSMIFAFLFSVFAPKLLEKHTLKIYAIRFASTAIMIYAAMQLTG
ncbi:MAG: EamA family transporter [Patescibacteria group bacterium]